MNNAALRNKLAALRATLQPDPEGEGLVSRDGRWWVAINPPFRDFNREIVPPGKQDTLPDGAVGLRCDGDFWTVAILPLEYVELDCKTLVETLWPEITDFECYPDSGDAASGR